MNNQYLSKPSKPILFREELIDKIINRQKTQTRRLMKPQPSEHWAPHSYGDLHKKINGEPDVNKPIGWGVINEDGYEGYLSRKGKPGDLLWVKESHKAFDDGDIFYKLDYGNSIPIHGDDNPADWRWVSPLFMKKEYARLWLRIDHIWVERLHQITNLQAKAEGCESYRWNPGGADISNVKGVGWKPAVDYRDDFSYLWDSINTEDGTRWKDNPWVWVIYFNIEFDGVNK